MPAKNGVYSQYDLEAAKILNDFIPEKIFDAHMHHNMLSQRKDPDSDDFSEYKKDFLPLFGENRTQRINLIPFPEAGMSDPVTGKATAMLDASTDIIKRQLALHPEIFGEVMTAPGDTEEDIENRMRYAGIDRIAGFKPYHLLSLKKPTFQADIADYLPESAWETAQKYHKCITLHLVKDRSLSDPENLSYIKEHAKRYPDAKLILAHCARSFAAWTGIESIGEVAGFDNIFYDFSGICESPSMFMIIKKAGIDKCMWGSDYTVSLLAGKAISIADSFYWIGEKDLERFAGPTEFHSWLVGTENLMAVRQAAIMLDLTSEDIEKLFCKNAERIFIN